MAETDLVPIENIDIAVFFTKPDDVDKLLSEIEEKALSFVPVVDTASGRKEIASMAHKVARSKTLLDSAGKDLVSGWKANAKKVDGQRKIVRDRLDGLKAKVRQPLTDWEEAEKARQEKHEDRIQAMKDLAVDRNIQDSYGENLSSSELKKRLSEIESLEIGEVWEEYADEAAQVREDCIAKLKVHIEAREKYEAEQAELEQLRREAEERKAQEEAERLERERKERDELIAREAAERAKREAEQEAQRQQEEAAKREREAIEAKERAEREKEEAEANAERDRIAAEERAKVEKELAVKAEQERAAKAEQDRIAKEAAEKAAAEKKAANKRHRAKIDSDVLADLELFGLDEADAKNLIKHMASGDVRHVTINY